MNTTPDTQTTVPNPFAVTTTANAPTGAAAAAVVQREIAEVQAAMTVAKKFPRDPIAAMDRILQACARPTLAQTALYQYQRGGSDISGPSIRLAEELARNWGNIVCGVTELTRTTGVSECLAYAWDMESNYRDEKRFVVRHWRDTKSGGYAVKDERDIYEIIANQGARRKRACLLSVIPGDVQETALAQCELTLKTHEDVTPERLAAMVDAFEKFGVTKTMMEKRIQRRFDAMTPALMVQLRRIFNSLRDGMSAAADWFEPVDPVGVGGEAYGVQTATTGTAGVRQALRAKRTRAPNGPVVVAPAATAQAEPPTVVEGTATAGGFVPTPDPEDAALEADRARAIGGAGGD